MTVGVANFYRVVLHIRKFCGVYYGRHYRPVMPAASVVKSGKNGQIRCQLFERLLASSDLKDVLAVAREEKVPADAKQIIKDPLVLEFLGKREVSRK